MIYTNATLSALARTLLYLRGLVPLNPQTPVGIEEERVGWALKFSREFRSLQALKSEFSLSKVPNSLENFGLLPDCLCTKGFPKVDFSLSKLSENGMVSIIFVALNLVVLPFFRIFANEF